jgi:hypothetical protein
MTDGGVAALKGLVTWTAHPSSGVRIFRDPSASHPPVRRSRFAVVRRGGLLAVATSRRAASLELSVLKIEPKLRKESATRRFISFHTVMNN